MKSLLNNAIITTYYEVITPESASNGEIDRRTEPGIYNHFSSIWDLIKTLRNQINSLEYYDGDSVRNDFISADPVITLPDGSEFRKVIALVIDFDRLNESECKTYNRIIDVLDRRLNF